MKRESTFTGSNWGLIWRSIVMTYGMAFTLFIATPWLISWYNKWYYENTIIDNNRLMFTGEGRDMFFYYKYFLLALVTLGISSIFMLAWLQRKTMAFVHLVDSQ